jgi:hypothetical protein
VIMLLNSLKGICTPDFVCTSVCVLRINKIGDGGFNDVSGGKKKLHSLSPRANYTDRATAACRRSDCQLLRIEGATWSA